MSKQRTRRIAFLLDDLGGGGVQRATMTLANALARRGDAITILLCDSLKRLAHELDPAVRTLDLPPGGEFAGRLAALRADPGGFLHLARPMLLPRKRTQAAAFLPGLADVLRRERPDVLISATAPLNVVAVLARWRAGWDGKLILTERTAPSEVLAAGPNWRKRHLPALMRRLYARADAVVAVSNDLADDLAGVTGLPRPAISTIYNPVVDDGLTARAREAVDHLWLADGRPAPVVLGVGRLDEQKDFPTLVRAFARLRARGPARLVILGAARDRAKTEARHAELRALAAGLGCADDVELPGFVRNPFAWMARADLFALSSRYEGLAAVLVQALACGCPSVATDCPTGPSEILQRGRLGRLVPVGDDAALAEAMAATLASPPSRAALVARARDFSADAATGRYLALLDRLDAPATAPHPQVAK